MRFETRKLINEHKRTEKHIKTKNGANEQVEVRADAVEGGANETEGGADEVEGGADVEEE